MIDREKVIKGLEEAHAVIEKHVPVRYWGYSTFACTDAIALLKAQPTVDGWISVKDRLPDEKENWITKDYQKVICCCDFGGDPQRIDVRTYGFGNGHFWHGPQIMDGVVTHWMPLPEPPKEVVKHAEQ